MAEGATARTSADLSWLPARYGWRGALQHHVERRRDTVTAVLARARPPIAPAAAVVLARRTRFLLITAGKVADEVFGADALRVAAPTRVRTLNVPSASHAAALEHAPEAWRHHVIPFLRTTLDLDAPAD